MLGPARTSRPSMLMLSLLAVTLTGVIGWELGEDRNERSPEPAAAAQPASALAARKVRAGDEAADQARTALARPLFQPDRRPGTIAPSALAATEALPRLTALLSGPFGRRAIFAGADGRLTSVEEGAALGGWTVVAIGAEGVSVAGRDGERVVLLGRGSGAQAVTRTPAVAEEPDEHAGGGALSRPKAGPMFLYPGDPPAGRR